VKSGDGRFGPIAAVISRRSASDEESWFKRFLAAARNDSMRGFGALCWVGFCKKAGGGIDFL